LPGRCQNKEIIVTKSIATRTCSLLALAPFALALAACTGEVGTPGSWDGIGTSSAALTNGTENAELAVWGTNCGAACEIPADATNLAAISAGTGHMLALKNDGTVISWGSTSIDPVPQGLGTVVAIAAGGVHNLALKADGTVVCWGRNLEGQCNIPAGLSGVKAIAAGQYHSLALRTDGTVVAWGSNATGQATVPYGLSGVVAIGKGEMTSFAIRYDGSVVGWGRNDYGQTTVPPGLTGIVAVSSGGYHTIALRSDGTVLGWGDNWGGQISIPAGLSGVTAISANGYHTLARKSDGMVVAWGVNGNGQTDIPAGIKGLGVAAGWSFSAILKEKAQLLPAVAAFASSHEDSCTFAAKATDGDTTGSRWSSKWTDNEWISLDLGAARTISGVKLTWENASAKEYVVQGSNDGISWSNIASKNDGVWGPRVDEYVGLVAAARYVRMQGVKRTSGYGYSLYEMQVFGPAGSITPDVKLTSSTTPVTATSTEIGFSPANVVDTGHETRWGSSWSGNPQADTQSITLDLGTYKSITSVYLEWEGIAAYGKDYKIQVSNNGTTFTTVRSIVGADGNNDLLTALAVTGRYVRMQGVKRGTGYGYSLYNFEVYGK
jgi:hypothetical protein